MMPPSEPPAPIPDGPEFLEALRSGSGFLRTVLEHMREGFALIDPEGVHIYVNPALVEMTGFSEEELVGAGAPHPYWPPEEVPRIEAAFRNTLAGRPDRVDLVFRRQNGERFPVIVTPAQVSGPSGDPIAFFATVIDDTERRATEDALRTSEQRWRSLVENPFDFVVIIDRDYRFQFVNHTAGGLTQEDLIGKATPFDFVDERYHADMKRTIDRAFEQGQPGEYEAYTPLLDKWFLSIVGPLRQDGEVMGVSILTRDVTASKRAEIALRESEQRFDAALRGSSDGLFDVDLATGKIFYSPRFYELLGYEDHDPELVPGPGQFRRRLHPEDRDETIAAFERARAGNEPFNREYRLRLKDGNHRWFHGRARTFHEDGEPTRFAGFVTDIEERKQSDAERRRLEEQLAQSQKLETIGTLAGGIAHDFNNLLLPIMAHTEFAREALGADHEVQEDLAGIARAAARARDLVHQILTFSRRAESKREPIDVSNIIQETIRFLESSIPSTIEIEADLATDCPTILGDPTQIQQVATNLVTNAWHAMRDVGGTLRIRVSYLRIELGDDSAPDAPGPGEYVRITVSDTGPGIEDAVAARLFEPFFTTKAPGEGSGLGLAVVHGIVRRHGGAIRVDGSSGRGATFDVYLPVARTPGPASPGPAPDAADASVSVSGRRVLCVDDEPTVLAVMERSLTRLGCRVTVTTSSLDALALLREDSSRFDLLVTDQTMPRLTGLELTRAAAELRPGLPILLVTGFSEAVTGETARAVGIRATLQKPFGPDELARSLGVALAHLPSPGRNTGDP